MGNCLGKLPSLWGAGAKAPGMPPPQDLTKGHPDRGAGLAPVIGLAARTGQLGPMAAGVLPRVDPAQFLFANQVGAELVKLPGSLGGAFGEAAPFAVQDCRDCAVFVLDYTGQITVDACTDCFLFLGPCAGAVFLRDCSNCTVVSASRQFRVRDLKTCTLLLHVATQPILESSTDLTIGCFFYNYPGLAGQFTSAGLSVLDNQWWNFYDFTGSNGDSHWKRLTEMEDEKALLKRPKAAPVEVDWSTSAVPKTAGPFCSAAFVVLSLNDQDAAVQRHNTIVGHARVALVHSRVIKLPLSDPALFRHWKEVQSGLFQTWTHLCASSNTLLVVLAYKLADPETATTDDQHKIACRRQTLSDLQALASDPLVYISPSLDMGIQDGKAFAPPR